MTKYGKLATAATGNETTTYTYDEMGNLLEVGLSDGRSIEYIVDGMNRRIGKKADGVPVQGFLYNDAMISSGYDLPYDIMVRHVYGTLKPVAELDGTGTVMSIFVYGTSWYMPDYMIRGGERYRFVTDQVGSVRMVVNVETGEIAQRMDYDEFGRMLMDTNPEFQPFGFAGGLYDPDTGLVRFGARDYDPEVGR